MPGVQRVILWFADFPEEFFRQILGLFENQKNLNPKLYLP